MPTQVLLAGPAPFTRLGIMLPGEGQALGSGTLVALDDGSAVLIGDSRWWKHQAETTSSFRYDAQAAGVLLADGSVLVVGGADDPWSASGLPSTERFVPGP